MHPGWPQRLKFVEYCLSFYNVNDGFKRPSPYSIAPNIVNYRSALARAAEFNLALEITEFILGCGKPKCKLASV
jgi:hypothetical protein